MDMLWHDHVTDDYRLMTLADLLHDFQKQIARAWCAGEEVGADNSRW
jgi:hypothetical protein